MSDTLSKFIAGLKQRLTDNQAMYVEHYSMLGDTEIGFFDTDEFDLEKLMNEIDKFSEEFKKEK